MTQNGDEEAFEKLVLANLGLVVFVVKKLPQWNYAGSLERSDLISEGNIALMQAIRTWKPTHRLATYARGIIYSRVYRAIEQQENLISVPVNVQERLRRLKKLSNTLTQHLGREPTIKELTEASSMPPEDVHNLLQVSNRQPISLDSLNKERFNEEPHDHE